MLAATSLSRPTTTIAKARIGVGHGVGGNRGRTELGDEIRVLVSLRLSEVERLNLRLEALNLSVLVLHTVGDNLVVKSAIVRVLVVGNIPCSVGDSRGHRAGISSDCSIEVSRGKTVLAAAIRDLSLNTGSRDLVLVTKLGKPVGQVVELLKIGVTLF